jgi:hypothetical protein
MVSRVASMGTCTVTARWLCLAFHETTVCGTDSGQSACLDTFLAKSPSSPGEMTAVIQINLPRCLIWCSRRWKSVPVDFDYRCPNS